MDERGHPVHFSFGNCDETIISRAIVAATDQLCSMIDMSLDLLDALEYPLRECVAAIHRHGIARATVGTHDQTLRLEIGLHGPISGDLVDVFGDAYDVVASFFEITSGSDGTSLLLEGSLR